MIKAILFDCFGVVYMDHFEKVYAHFGGDAEKEEAEIYQALFDISKGTLNEYDFLANRFGVTRKQWDEVSAQLSGFNKNLLKYIVELRKRYRVGMLSNVGTEGLEEFMDYGVLEAHFDVICESAKIGFAKPEARAYEISADKLGVRLDECVFTDDRPPYIEGAQAVGMHTILFKSTEQFIADLEELLQLNS